MYDIDSLKNIPFFFILSMGRSGSTLLEFLLDAHPNINIPLESRFIIHLYAKYGNRKKWSDDDKKMLLIDLYKDYKLKNFWDINHNKLEREIMNSPNTISFFDICRIITANYISFYPKSEVKIQGSKNPIYALWTDVLYDLNPNAKFIHLVRNPFGVVASHKKLGEKNLNYFAYRWNLMNQKVELLKKKRPAQFITVKYEELLENPEKTLLKICNFLNIEYHSSQLSFYQAIAQIKKEMELEDESVKKKLFDSHLKNLVNPINTEYKESWRDTLTTKEIEQINFITQDVANSYSYNSSEKMGSFKISYVFVKLVLRYRYLKLRYYYKFSLSIK